jgi:hypothetical protein
VLSLARVELHQVLATVRGVVALLRWGRTASATTEDRHALHRPEAFDDNRDDPSAMRVGAEGPRDDTASLHAAIAGQAQQSHLQRGRGDDEPGGAA